MKKEFSKAEEVNKERDLYPNKRYNGFDALVDVAEYMRANFIRKKLQQHQQQQLSHPSPMITGEKGIQCFSGKNAVDNACKKNDIPIPPKNDISKLEKKMAMTSRRVISSMSESPEGMSWEEFLTKERLLKRLKEIEEENMMQVKRDCKKVVRFEDSDSDSEECRARKTQTRSSKRSDPSLMITCEECKQYFSGQNTRKPLAIDNACKKVRPKEAVLDISKHEKKMAMTSQRVITKSEYPEGMTRGEIFRREKILKRPMEFDDENVMQKRVKRDCKRVVRFEDSDYDSEEEEEEEEEDNSSKKEEKKKNKGSFPNPPRELPEKFMSRITAMGGKNLKCVITKRLTVSDCTTTEGRLSMPFSQIAEFLFDDEKVHLQGRNESNRKNEKKVKLTQPNHEDIDISLRQWDMPKPRGLSKIPRGVSKMYVLVKPWNEVVRKNGLREGEAIQVWSFRVGELDELRLVIVRLSDDEEPANAGQLLYGEGPSNVGQLSYGEGTSNIGQLRIESDCAGTSVNGEEPDDVISTPEYEDRK